MDSKLSTFICNFNKRKKVIFVDYVLGLGFLAGRAEHNQVEGKLCDGIIHHRSRALFNFNILRNTLHMIQ